MRTPRTISKNEIEAFWAAVREDFPDDEMMQEVHFVRLLHAAQLDKFTPEERAAYFNSFAPYASETDPADQNPR